MASGDARPVPRKNAAFRVTFPILDADGDLVTGATGLDSEVSKDQGTYVDCTNEATEIATNSGTYFLDLTSTEMNADTVSIIVKTSSVGAKSTVIVLYPEEIGDYRADVQQWLGTAVATPTVAGVPEVDPTHWNGTAVLTPHTAGAPVATIKDGTGTGELDTSSGAVILQPNSITASVIATDGAAKIRALITGISDSGTTTTMVDAARTEADADYFVGSWILFTSGTLLGQVRLIVDFDPGSDTITFTPATTQAVSTHSYEILPNAAVDLRLWLGTEPLPLQSGRVESLVGAMSANTVTASAVATDAIGSAEFAQAAADKVWASSSRTLTSLGAAVVQEIWDRATSALTTVGSIGKLLVDNVNATISSRATPAQVNTEVVDALSVDTYAEPGQEAPNATNTLATKIGYLFKFLRNKHTQTATTFAVLGDDASTVHHKATVSDDGTTFTREEIVSGP